MANRQRPLALRQCNDRALSGRGAVPACVLRNVLRPRSGDSPALRAIRAAVAKRLTA